MLKDRIVSTLRFFDLQSFPLTLLELHKFLLNDVKTIKQNLKIDWEVGGTLVVNNAEKVGIDEILKCIHSECRGYVENYNGFYYLTGRRQIAEDREKNYLHGIYREKRIKKFTWILKHIPFVRGAGLVGSQAMGVQKKESDIDLLVITDHKFLWLTRTFVTSFFQIFGVRRHGKFVTNRFCLNHYIANPKSVDREKNLYKAMEYLKIRPLAYPQTVVDFLNNNNDWISFFFPNAEFKQTAQEAQSVVQKILEKLFQNSFGLWLEKKLKIWQQRRIKQEKFTFVLEDELSFHPDSQHENLLASFFKLEQ